MARYRTTWLAFALCLAVVLGAMGWVSRTVLRVEHERLLAQRHAAFEDAVRLALWRMDTAVAPLLAAESARPHFAYRAFFEPRAMAPGATAPGQLLAPSPLLREPPDHVLVYFEFDEQGRLTSPQTPEPERRALAIPMFTSEESVAKAERRLRELGRKINRDSLLTLLPDQATRPAEWVVAAPAPSAVPDNNQMDRRNNLPKQGRAAVEFEQRVQAVWNVAALSQQQLRQQETQVSPDIPVKAPPNLDGAAMTPLWMDGQLMLARRVEVDGLPVVQGCLLDWPAIHQSLLDGVADLLPRAQLLPVLGAGGEWQARRLASLPMRVAAVPGEATSEDSASGLRLSLAAAWACALLAAAAVAGLLWGVLQLSERRAAFVSAVTHELRTPLTSVQMYAEMLADGMVTDRAQRAEYLATLRREASRLSHLVENVLGYARLERGRARRSLERIAMAKLLDRVVPRLTDRVCQADMLLEVDLSAVAAPDVVAVNPGVVEQILFNLVDNACKYARHATDRRIHLAAERNGDGCEVSVRDHGPGVADDVARRLFRPFSKSARDAAESAPGVGLGLALSRRLAREMGGELRLKSAGRDGSTFLLQLRRDRTQPDDGQSADRCAGQVEGPG